MTTCFGTPNAITGVVVYTVIHGMLLLGINTVPLLLGINTVPVVLGINTRATIEVRHFFSQYYPSLSDVNTCP